MIAVDTNLLIYAHRSALPEHEAARDVIRAAAADPRGWGIALPSIAEFWRVVTHPRALGRPSTAAEARDFVQSLVSGGGAELWQPGPRCAARLLELAVDREAHASAIFDLQIALVAFDNGATEIWTHDRDFLALGGMKVVDPLS